MRTDASLWQVAPAHAKVCIANATHGVSHMKSATLPSLRVEPKLRKAAEAVLRDGESLSSFMEQSLRDEVNRRRMQAEFIVRGLAARDEAERTGVYYDADTVHAELRDMLAKAEAKARSKAKAKTKA